MRLDKILTISSLFFTIPSYSQALLHSELLEEVSQTELTAITGFPALYGVEVYKVQYLTTGSDNQPDTASGLVVFPDNTSIVRIIAYQHGTTAGPEDVPSNLNGEATLVKAFAGQGYIVTAADYLGLGDSRGFHPYVHAATEASAGVDLLIAGRELAGELGFSAVQQIFVTGYSQGGHGAMAMAQALQERPTDDLWITAAAPMSGPYSISDIMQTVTLQDTQEYFYPSYAVYIVLGYQEIYGNLYDSIEEVFKPVFIGMIKSFHNQEITLDVLNQFLINQLINDTGKSIPKDLFNESYLNAVLNDSLHPAQVALRDNDTYRWVPGFPMRLYYCMADDQVSFMNSLVAEEYMQGSGAQDVQAIDVFPSGDHGGCVVPAVLSALAFFNGFDPSTATREYNFWQNMSIAPNPVSDDFQINVSEDLTSSHLQIYNQMGELVLEKHDIVSSGISVRDLPDGIYFLTVRNPLRGWRTAFVIQR